MSVVNDGRMTLRRIEADPNGSGVGERLSPIDSLLPRSIQVFSNGDLRVGCTEISREAVERLIAIWKERTS